MEYKEFETHEPSLTLEPELETVTEVEVVPQEQPEAPQPVLTEQEQQMVAAFAEKIDVDENGRITGLF